MALPTSYLTSFKNLSGIFSAIQNAQAPKNFTTRFLESLGYKNAADRLIIGVLKSLGFLSSEGAPTNRYFEFLDQTQSKRVMAEGIREAYADLYQVNRKAHELSGPEIRNKLKTLTQGQASDSVLEKMAGTFKALALLADFSSSGPAKIEVTPAQIADAAAMPGASPGGSDAPQPGRPAIGGLVYNIQLILPADRDRAVYDALFRSLKEHLLS